MELSELTPVWTNGYSIYEINGRLFITGASDVSILNADNITVNKATTISAHNVTTINIDNDCTMQVNGAYNLKANVINIEAESGLFLKSNADIISFSARTTNIRSNERMSLDGSIIDLNNNTSKVPPEILTSIAQQLPLDSDYAIYSAKCSCC